MVLHDDEEAGKDLKAAKGLVPGDAAITNLLEEVKQRKEAKRNKQKAAFKGLFSSRADETSETQ